MKKLSWPYTGSIEKEMGSMAPTGDSDRDIAPNVNDGSVGKNYGTFNDHFSGYGEEAYDNGHEYSGGTFFPVHGLLSDIEEAEYSDDIEGLNSFANNFIRLLDKRSTIVGWGPQDNVCLQKLNDNYNIISLSNYLSLTTEINRFATRISSPMFFDIQKKADGFYNSKLFSNLEEAEISIKNIYSNLKPIAYSLFFSKSNLDIEPLLKKYNFTLLNKRSGSINKYLVKKNDVNKIAKLTHYNNKNISTIICDVADSSEDKRIGLQSYASLGNNRGLLFRYAKDEDRIFHMGTVSFPIDIGFLDKNNKIKKVYKNIKPGSLELFSCASARNVFETRGGLFDELGISIGDRLFIEYGDQALAGVENNHSNFIHKNAASKITGRTNYKIAKPIGEAKEDKIIFFDAKDFISNDSIKLYRKASDGTVKMGLDSEAFFTTGNFIKIAFDDFFKSSFQAKINEKYSANLSDVIFPTLKNSQDLIKKMAAKHRLGYEIGLIYPLGYDALALAKSIEKSSSYLLDDPIFIRPENTIIVPSYYSADESLAAISQRWPNKMAELASLSLTKVSGIPVSDDIKEKARSILKNIDRAYDLCGDLTDNINKNSSIYEKLVEKPEVIKNSAGEYSESAKRNSRICKKILLNIKETIETLSEIQDISTTEEVISSLADISKVFSKAIKEIFDLISVIDTDNFVTSLTEATKNGAAAIDDLKITIERTKSYITKDILGIVIISE
jgi:uncharacterized membrane protein (UPF0127 family)/methyl-accepting chemotaxis protein